MNKTKHTQGKWFACCLKSTPHFVFQEHGEQTICSISKKGDDGIKYPIKEVRANAKLIAAAPELLEALESLLEHVRYVGLDNYYQKGNDKEMKKAEEAIKKATL